MKDFLRRAEACGARYFEFSHLFTQWGAQAAPKIVVEAFIDRGKPFWAYYCFPQCGGYLSNRIMNMPCERTRVIGMQLFASGAAGFLHWGYNFYNTALSVRRVDPFFETDAGGAFESGDAFIVYPGAAGAYGSLRLELIRAAVQDHRALQLLASLTGRENACALLKAHGVEAFDKYPHGREAFLRVREAIDRAIAEHV